MPWGLLGNMAPIRAQSMILQHPVGSWLSTVTIPVDGDPAHNIVFQGVETYMLGGGYIETDQLSFSPTLGLSTPSHGYWASTGGSNFLMTYLNFTFDSTGTAQGKGLVRQTATISADKKSYSGSGDFSYFDPTGNLVLGGTFTVTATRIEVQAPAAVTTATPLVQVAEQSPRTPRLATLSDNPCTGNAELKKRTKPYEASATRVVLASFGPERLR